RLPHRSIDGSVTDTELLTDVAGEVDQTVRVTPLVVVPTKNLDEALGLVDGLDHGHEGVEGARGGTAHDVRGHDRLVGVDDDAAQGSFGRRLEGRVDLLDRRRA